MNLTGQIKHMMILTGEPSGDFHAGHLVRQIKKINSRIYFSGIGGPNLENENVDLFFHIENLSAMGITEVVMQFTQIKKAFDLFKMKLKKTRPDLIILVDYPGFNLKAAQFAKENYPVRILYYITPKVWAWKKSRLKAIKKYVDHAALIFPFEEKIYKKAGIRSTYVGNPLMDEYPENLSKTFLRSDPSHNKDKTNLVIGLLPGSRNAEIHHLFEILIKTGDLIHKENKNVRFIISKAGSLKRETLETILKKMDRDPLSQPRLFQISDRPVKEIFLKSDLVIAASGTVTLEAALCCVPTIIIYKMSWFSYRMAKFFVKIKYAGLANLIVNREVMPELLQNDATSCKISRKALYMLDHLADFENHLQPVRKLLGNKGASERAARIAMDMLRTADL